ncbi:MAG: DNA-deoxyinosine glycosylase [Lachnospiraceae bacterium]|nr:DNA-deoxyinosine glycosylase [Lachnospiraceae bacterium]
MNSRMKTVDHRYQHVEHTFEPVYDEESEILILGTFPSVKSREQDFYYGHPQNRFWKVLANLTGEKIPQTVEDKKEMLLKHHIAIWDVVQSCDIIGSSDSSIKNVVPADLNYVLTNSNITRIFVNGDKAYKLYKKYCQEATGRDAVKLPSTSPANAVFTLERLICSWRELICEQKEERNGI